MAVVSNSINPKTVLTNINHVMQTAPYALSDAIDFFRYRNSPNIFRSHENSGTFHTFREENFITRCLEPTDREGAEQYRLNYNKFIAEVDPELISIKPSMANHLIDELDKNNICHLAFETKNQGEGPKTYIMTGIEDHELRGQIVGDFNRNLYYSREFSPKELLESFKETGFVRIDRIEKDIFDQMEREKALCFPHCISKSIRGGTMFYSITVPARYGEALDRCVTQSSMYLSGNVKDIARQYYQERKEDLENIYRALGDNKKSFIVVNGANPDQRIMSEKNIIAIYRAGKEHAGIELVKNTNGPQTGTELFGKLDKQAGSRWQTDLHKELGRYAYPILIENDGKALEKIQAIYGKEGFARNINTFKAMSAKYHFTNALFNVAGKEIIKALPSTALREEKEGIFYKDNQIRFANGIDHAIIIKDDNLKYDLQGDQALNERGKGGLTQVIDYSDLCDSYSQTYRETTEQTKDMDGKTWEGDIRDRAEWKAGSDYAKYLCAYYGITHEDQSPEEKENIEYRMENSYGFRALISLSKEARSFVLQDMDVAIDLAKTVEPRELTHADFEYELNENARSISHTFEEREQEFDL